MNGAGKVVGLAVVSLGLVAALTLAYHLSVGGALKDRDAFASRLIDELRATGKQVDSESAELGSIRAGGGGSMLFFGGALIAALGGIAGVLLAGTGGTGGSAGDSAIEKIADAIKNQASGATPIGQHIDVPQRTAGNIVAADIAEAVNALTAKLRRIMDSVVESAEQLNGAAESLAASIQEISSGADQQISRTGQVAKAFEEDNVAISDIAQNVLKLSEATDKTTNHARNGGDIINQSAETIIKLNEYSSKIENILTVIDDIAKKTDLLAINAAIEAANAGDQGRGFAVVADEVRKLAERTTKATGEISVMINDIQSLTAKSAESMNRSREAMETIISESDKVNRMVEGIAAAAEEQSATAMEIGSSVEAVFNFTKETAAKITHGFDEALELSKLAEKLKTTITNQ